MIRYACRCMVVVNNLIYTLLINNLHTIYCLTVSNKKYK